MKMVRAFFVRLRGLLDRRRSEREFSEELECHLQWEIDANLRSGMNADQARRQALLKSGRIAQTQEAWRDRHGLPSIENAWRDLRHATRTLRRSPGFTSVAILSLALGIGACCAVFTLMDRLLLRRLPVPNPQELAMIWTTGPGLGSTQGIRGSSYPMYQDFQQRAEAFSYVFCRYLTALSVSAGGQAERVTGELVSGNYFQALGVGPALGRVFSPEEDDRIYKGHPSVVLSYPYWVARFGSDPSVIGRKILVNNYPMVVVGVSASGFSGLDPIRSPQIRIPIQMKPLMTPASDNLGDRRRQWVQVFARIKPGYSLRAAEASLQPLLRRILRVEMASPALRNIPRSTLDRFAARRVVMESAATGYSDLRSGLSAALAALMGMACLVLLIACFNVACLLLARVALRRKELAMRVAIGASRWQIARHLLLESAFLASAGVAAGILLSGFLVRGLLHFLPVSGMMATLEIAPDWRVLAFAAAPAFAVVLQFGLLPARQVFRLDLCPSLKEGPGAAGGNRASMRLRQGLVAAQMAFSFLLVAGALLFARTVGNLKSTTSGFAEIHHLLTFQIDPARSGYSLPRLQAFYQQTLESARALPGVQSAGYAWIQVLSDRRAGWDIVTEGAPPASTDHEAFINSVSPGYWRTMGIPLLAGRDFADSDTGSRARVAIVNRRFAQDLFGGANPVGRHIGLDTGPGSPRDITIVGMVEDALFTGPRQGMHRQVFFPYAQLNQPVAVAFYVRSSASRGPLFAAMKQRVAQLDANLPVYEMKTVGDQLDETLNTERLTAALSGAAAALATLLAAVGLYGMMALAVARRTREIGLRMAVGARRGAVLWMVIAEALRLLAVALVVGAPAAYGLSRWIASQLYGVAPGDLASDCGAAVVLAAVAILAAFLPARRAAAIDPVRALRQE